MTLFSTAKSSKTVVNHSKIMAVVLCASILDYSLAQRKNTHVPGVRATDLFSPGPLPIFIAISVSGNNVPITHTKFKTLLEKMHHSDSLAQQTFKPCSLEQLLCDEHHRGCAEQATPWGYSPKYKHASLVIQCAAKTVTQRHNMELLLEKADLS